MMYEDYMIPISIEPYRIISRDEDDTRQLLVNKEPTKCPFCHRKIAPKYLGTFDREICGEKIKTQQIQVICICPLNDCRELFIANYLVKEDDDVAKEVYIELQSVSPYIPSIRKFETVIQKFSPEFVDIYNQSYKAEQLQLSSISGMGYRKALEFLIKDYLIKQVKVQNVDEIKKMLIGKCIDQYIQNDNIKQIAKRAIWLGNDETHYERRWIDKDINDLKQLIDITIYWITMTEKTKEILQSMPNGK
ncbi:hypothetical protein QTL86_04185 [Cellulosilyticum sp. ST5]|uniref:hypothetical protein n=1 Tax=Cellulosilyticum sp. ST5 TaxID=3055805 RepID=UPI0039777E66